MPSQDYLVEMTFTPFGSPLSPQEALGFTERMALPTMEALEALAASGKILAGGTYLAAGGFIFIARVGSPQDLEDTLCALPLWPRAQVRVVPLGTFASRASFARGNLNRLRAAQEPAGSAS